LLFFEGKPMATDWTTIKERRTPEPTTEEEAVEVTDLESDPFGLARLERGYRPASFGTARRAVFNPDDVKPEEYVILRASTGEADTSTFYADEKREVLLWLLKVKEVYRNANGEAVKWRVVWWTPNGSGGTAKFFSLREPEDHDVNIEALVAHVPKLTKGNRIPKPVLVEAAKVVSLAVTAEVNGNVRCVVCEEDKEGEELLACGSCGKHHHFCCVEGGEEEDWWCTNCRAE
jgi:hypothetical protein